MIEDGQTRPHHSTPSRLLDEKKGGGIDMQVKSKGKDVCVFSLQ